MGNKYGALQSRLEKLGASEIPMTFKEIEAIIGAPLPPSAFKHRPWWSNNPSNSVITHAWLRAGYETCKVDMGSQKLIFRRRTSPPSRMSGGSPAPLGPGKPPPNHGADARRSLFGALKGLVRFSSPGAAVEPTGERWKAEDGRL